MRIRLRIVTPSAVKLGIVAQRRDQTLSITLQNVSYARFDEQQRRSVKCRERLVTVGTAC